MESKLQIGEKIKNKRLLLNLRMDDVAKAVGITRSTLWSIENGVGNYTIDTLLKLLSLLNMSIDISGDNNETRMRATRINSALDKKINRFLIMCVEQYAASIDEGSGEVYKKLQEYGILDELKDDYEDMHGMSTYSINEYINKRLGLNDNNQGSHKKHATTNMILIGQTVELIAKRYKLSIEEARNRFYESDVINLLDDEETGLYGESALYLLSLFEERYTSKNDEKVV